VRPSQSAFISTIGNICHNYYVIFFPIFEIASIENQVGVLAGKSEGNDGGDSQGITPRALG
jgi:hypothetical protein